MGFSKNDIPPNETLPNSAKSVWWQCKINPKHTWKAKVYSRSRYNYACPFCAGRVADENNNLVITHPEIAREWDFEKNRKDPTEYKAGSNVKVWWKCKKGNDHIWLSSINNRTNGKNCPICSGRKVV